MTEQELERQRAVAKALLDEIETYDWQLINRLAHVTLEDNNFQVSSVLYNLKDSFDNRGNPIGDTKKWLEGTTYTQEEVGEVYDLLHKILHIASANGWWTITEIEPILFDLRSFDELQAEGYWG